MGEQRVSLVSNEAQMQQFVRYLLNDMQALDHMLTEGWFETNPIRIGAEQEMVIIDAKTYKPAPIAMKVLRNLKEYDWLESELAKFNLETNLQPREFRGDCLRQLEQENLTNIRTLRKRLKRSKANILLTGILPTLRKFDLGMDNLTPKKRYKALMEAIDSQLVDGQYELRLNGIDELSVTHDSPLLEACNTSFQVHLQVAPKDFAGYYNVSQVLAAPVMAVAANSPVLFGRRLWHETRIALFQQALDTRSSQEHLRQRSPRVNFGSGWLDKSILEIYREDIARFRVLLAGDVTEDSLTEIAAGRVPKLRALQVHNSTVYRWNRPCYGISDNGKPHLRIENRVLPAGPTILDETANATLWLGAMVGAMDQHPNIREQVSYADVRDNFLKAAKFGIDSNFTWFGNCKVTATDLILNEILPLARHGLTLRGVDSGDADRYLGVIEERAKRHTNGARWQLRAFTQLTERVPRDEAVTIMTARMLKNQEAEIPVHEWQLPTPEDLEDYRPFQLKVSEFMETDLFTVQKNDLIDLVADMMEWRKIRYMPVEDQKGHLVGLITARKLLRHYKNQCSAGRTDYSKVHEIMAHEPVTIGPDASIRDALRSMRLNKLGCLPVVKEGELIGIITEMDFLRISGRLIERIGSREEEQKS